MTQQPCPNCPTLRAEVLQLQATVSMLLRIIAAAQNECAALNREAGEPMPKGVAPAVWSHALGLREGKGEAARRILRRLEH